MQKKSTGRTAPPEVLTDDEARAMAKLAKQAHHPLARHENVARAEAALEARRRASDADKKGLQL